MDRKMMGITGLPENYLMRIVTLDDVEAVVALVNACSQEVINKARCEVSEYRNDWQSPTMDMGTDLRVVLSPEERIVGYAGVWDPQPHVQIYGFGYVHPAHRGRGIGTSLANWIETRASESIALAPAGTQVKVSQRAYGADISSQQLLKEQGYTLARHWLRMLIELDASLPAPQLPDGLTIRTFDRERDLKSLIHADREAFRDHWGYVEHPFEEDWKEWMHWIETDPDYDPTLWFLVMDGTEIAGFSICAPKTAEDPAAGYIHMLAVRRAWRQQGVGLALLHHTFGEFQRRGKKRCALGVDATSLTGATRLYEKAGMHVQRQSVSYEKMLREGEDLSTQTL